MHRKDVSIWLFSGALLIIYGLIMNGYGVYELVSDALLAVGLF